MNSKKYIVDEDLFLHLLARDIELSRLEADGVDNWSYYSYDYEESLKTAKEIADGGFKSYYEDDLK